MSDTITIQLTDELQAAILRYLELRNDEGSMEFWTTPMEIARRDIGMAVLNALGLPTAPVEDDVDQIDLIPTPRSSRKQIPFITRARVVARDKFKCVTCSAERFLTIDHIVPVSKGGTDDEGNLQTLCSICNSKKGARLEGGGT